jgi:hypothetical protein
LLARLGHITRESAAGPRIIVLMKLLVASIVIVLVAGSVYADYKWRRWMAARKAEHERSGAEFKP